MRWPVAVAAIAIFVGGCGRLGFGGDGTDPVDAPDDDAMTDAPIDAELVLPNRVARYDMEDDPTDGLDDAIEPDRAARCVTGVSCPTPVDGLRGSAAGFANTQHARVTYGPWLATPNGYTISVWLYLDQQIDQVAVAKPYGAGSDDSWGLVAWGPAAGRGTCMETVDEMMMREDVCGAFDLPTLRWFHVAGRWDGQSKALFIDGVKVGEISSAPASLIDTNDMLIGADSNAGTAAYFWRGRIDELEVYDRGLTDAEIMMIYDRK